MYMAGVTGRGSVHGGKWLPTLVVGEDERDSKYDHGFPNTQHQVHTMGGALAPRLLHVPLDPFPRGGLHHRRLTLFRGYLNMRPTCDPDLQTIEGSCQLQLKLHHPVHAHRSSFLAYTRCSPNI